MRVIAGKYKRRTLGALTGTEVTRPTADRTKESLFNILAPKVHGALVIDLFAGSGALGIEALSRGAKKVVFVESNPRAFEALTENIKKLEIPQREFFAACVPVEKFLNANFRKTMLGWNEAEFAASTDVIIADPPYASSWYASSVEDIESSQLCAQQCLVVLEMSSRQATEIRSTSPWEICDERIYGAARILFWQRTFEGTHHEGTDKS
jgi:16S rRNA (guanine966-N2)-methyltransferase